MSDFDRLIQDIEQEAAAEGPAAVEQLRSIDSRLRLAGQLLELRRRRGITQRQLGELSGVQQADISRIERGEPSPPPPPPGVWRTLSAPTSASTRSTPPAKPFSSNPRRSKPHSVAPRRAPDAAG